MYLFLICPLLSGLIAQSIKFILKMNNEKFSLKNILTYAGMPSGHSAMVISLATITGLKIGWDSPVFAISFIFALVIIRDALGLRRFLGEQGKILNTLVQDLSEDKMLDEKYPHLIERTGHTPAQVIVGSIIGFLVSAIGYAIF